MTDAEHAAVLRRTIEMDEDVHLLHDPERGAVLRAIELLEAPELPMEVIEVPDWRADADRLADALDHLMEWCGRRWGPAVDALIAPSRTRRGLAMNFDLAAHLEDAHFYAAEFTDRLDDNLARALHDEEHAESRWRHTHGDDIPIPEGPRR